VHNLQKNLARAVLGPPLISYVIVFTLCVSSMKHGEKEG